jgi:hypothetical protein
MTLARIYPRCIREDGSGWVERREQAIAQQKSVCDARGIGVCPHGVALGLIPPARFMTCIVALCAPGFTNLWSVHFSLVLA